MDNHKFNLQPTTVVTMEVIRQQILDDDRLADATKRDYLAQILRCVTLYTANNLADIPADIIAFSVRFKKGDFPFEHFKTPKAYRAWRKKMITILKRAVGVAAASQERHSRNDAWSVLLREWPSIAPGNSKGIISISLLAGQARIANLEPHELSREWLVSLMDDLSFARRNAIVRAICLLEAARVDSPIIDKLFGPEALPDPRVLRRSQIREIPYDLDLQIIALVDSHCSGDFDEISNEVVDGKAPATCDIYKAALRKYTSTAFACGALSYECTDITEVFDRSIFIAVMRDWVGETRREYMISDRSKRSYAKKVMSLAASCGKDVSFMKKAIEINPSMKNGRAQETAIPMKTKIFCMHLLRSRKAELLFKSLHIRFYDRAVSLMSSTSPVPFSDHRIIQFGMLAAFAAIALWGVPLRIGNLHRLRHLGENPTLVLPHGARRRAHILIGAKDVKNRKPIRAHISDGPTRAIEILEWYLSDIRPRIPGSDGSDYLFPGYVGDVMGADSIRDWLKDHSRDLGLPMNPHNFRHGLATLYLCDHPGEYAQVAHLLCNTPETVRAYYAWIDEEAQLRKVQEEVAKLGGFHRDGQDEQD